MSNLKTSMLTQTTFTMIEWKERVSMEMKLRHRMVTRLTTFYNPLRDLVHIGGTRSVPMRWWQNGSIIMLRIWRNWGMEWEGKRMNIGAMMPTVDGMEDTERDCYFRIRSSIASCITLKVWLWASSSMIPHRGHWILFFSIFMHRVRAMRQFRDQISIQWARPRQYSAERGWIRCTSMRWWLQRARPRDGCVSECGCTESSRSTAYCPCFEWTLWSSPKLPIWSPDCNRIPVAQFTWKDHMKIILWQNKLENVIQTMRVLPPTVQRDDKSEWMKRKRDEDQITNIHTIGQSHCYSVHTYVAD